ncbi:MAG: tetratricopeptide repeat protein [Rhodobacteraceae bacterium]|nr:tetratricopeptide repeat protein [Paracoccaceae bacterium]
MRVSDSRGVNWTTGEEASAARLFAAMDGYFTFRADTLDQLGKLLEDDPNVPAGWILRGYLLLFSRRTADLPAAREAHARACALDWSATPAEQLHVQALKAWLDADALGAQRIWDAILTDTPHDLLAMRVQHFTAMMLGRPDYLRTLAGRSLATWDDAVPGAGFVYGMACMGLEEAGEYARAEALGRRGAELEPDDLWSVHSVAHVMEAEGRMMEGLAWMERPSGFWEGRGPMRHHLLWHEALFLYEAGRYDHALDYYDRWLAPAEMPDYLSMSDCVSFLVRLEVAGVACCDRWGVLAESGREMIDGRVLTFKDVHTLLVLAMAGDREGLQRLSASLAGYAHDGQSFDAEAAGRVGVPLAAALRARLDGDPAGAADLLLATRFAFPHMGGSKAQRDVLDIYLINCAIASGNISLSRRLLHEYLDLRPNSVPMQERLSELVPA